MWEEEVLPGEGSDPKRVMEEQQTSKSTARLTMVAYRSVKERT